MTREEAYGIGVKLAMSAANLAPLLGGGLGALGGGLLGYSHDPEHKWRNAAIGATSGGILGGAMGLPVRSKILFDEALTKGGVPALNEALSWGPTGLLMKHPGTFL